ncbi:MAG: universal stress protein [Anaerolineae bacterium]
MFGKILLATDGSAHSDRALDHVKSLAQKYGSEVIVFHAYHYIPEYISPSNADQILQGAKAAAEDIVGKAAYHLEAAGIPVRTMVDEGPAANEIVSLAANERCDLIVVGARGLGGVTGTLLGSVSMRVVSKTALPVLVVH